MRYIHNYYHSHEPHSCEPSEIYYDNHEHRFPKQNCKIPSYRTYGLSNPYYKCVDYYLMSAAPNSSPRTNKRAIHRLYVEDYIESFIGKGFKTLLDPNINPAVYYNTLLYWLNACYKKLRGWKITYSNLNEHDSAILVIRRVLSKYVCEEEMCKISQLFDLNLNFENEKLIEC